MRFGILIFSAIALLFASCDKSIPEEDEEQLRLNDMYHLEKVEFYLGEGDGLSVEERKTPTRTYNNTGIKETIVSVKDRGTFISTFYFEDNQPYTLVVDNTTRKIQVPELLWNNVLYEGGEVWTFRNEEPEESIIATYEHSWNIAPSCYTKVTQTITTSTITASFNAYFVGENTKSEVVMQGKWQGKETTYTGFEAVTDEIDK
ncbi:MAG: hypothetical protein LBV32_00915 [Tannerellaceae bacterium]|jgi:hypothetical protein|nr:hypothetical protein [Tannerellaceae bacterium]